MIAVENVGEMPCDRVKQCDGKPRYRRHSFNNIGMALVYSCRVCIVVTWLFRFKTSAFLKDDSDEDENMLVGVQSRGTSLVTADVAHLDPRLQRLMSSAPPACAFMA